MEWKLDRTKCAIERGYSRNSHERNSTISGAVNSCRLFSHENELMMRARYW
jgi:hypothetical protein